MGKKRSSSKHDPPTKFRLSLYHFVVVLLVWICIVVLLTPTGIIRQIKQNVRPSSSSSSRFHAVLSTQPTNIKLEDEKLCSTEWIKGITIQFIAFAVNGFSEVNFMMPGEFSSVKESQYKCLFKHSDGEITTYVAKFGGRNTLDPSGRTFHLRCTIPEEILENTPVSTTMTLDLGNGERYDFRICRTYKLFSNSQYHESIRKSKENDLSTKADKKSDSIGLCTIVAHGYTDILKIWLEYNIFIGVKHFYIYDYAPSNRTQLHYDLISYIERDYVTIVPWYKEIWLEFRYHNRNRRRHEIWSQNDCIQRYGYKHYWLGIFDIFEFPVFLGQDTTLPDILQKVPSTYCSYMMNNCFSMGTKTLESRFIKDPSKLRHFLQKDIVNMTNCDKGSRHFIRPSAVYYFRIHWLERTNKCSGSYKADQLNELRMNHYEESYSKVKSIQ